MGVILSLNLESLREFVEVNISKNLLEFTFESGRDSGFVLVSGKCDVIVSEREQSEETVSIVNSVSGSGVFRVGEFFQ